MRNLLIAGVIAVCVAAGGAAYGKDQAKASTPSCSSLIGKWKNELGSTLDIQSVDSTTGAIKGWYTSPSGGGSNAFPMVGWVNSRQPGEGEEGADVKQVIAFTVRWGQIGSITSWTGYCQAGNDGKPTIVTLWHLARPVSGFSWDHILANSDRFTPEP